MAAPSPLGDSNASPAYSPSSLIKPNMSGISPGGAHSGRSPQLGRSPHPIGTPHIDTKGNSPSPAYNPASPMYQGGGKTPGLADPLGTGGSVYTPNTPAYQPGSKSKK